MAAWMPEPNAQFDRDTQTVTAVSASLLECVIPLFRREPGERPKMAGTGFLIQAGPSAFLVMAAHVLDRMPGLYCYVARDKIWSLAGPHFKSNLPAGKTRSDDRFDVGVLQLADVAKPPWLDAGKRAIDLSQMRAQATPRDDKSYVFIGFPATCTRVNPVAKEITSQGSSYRNISATMRRAAANVALKSVPREGRKQHPKAPHPPHPDA